jgi:hypothetical protein
MAPRRSMVGGTGLDQAAAKFQRLVAARTYIPALPD